MSKPPTLSAQIDACGDVLAQRLISGHMLTREDTQSLLSACRRWAIIAGQVEGELVATIAAMRTQELMAIGSAAQPKGPDAGPAEAARCGVLLAFPGKRRAAHADHLHGDNGAA